jgi:hypothetical protein
VVTEIRAAGKLLQVPSVRIGDRVIIVTGQWLKIASILDEALIAARTIEKPELLIAELTRSGQIADLFTFVEKITDPVPRHRYPLEWDNVAAIRITSYEDWFRKRAGNDVRQNIKKSAKRGLTVTAARFDDNLVKGIVDIYNETPIRQGRRFWHYGKDFERVKYQTAHAAERSWFIGAYYRQELVGFIKLLRTGNIADIVLIVCKQAHRDKKPANALIAKAVEICVENRIELLTYAQFFYEGKTSSSLLEFKKRNGFEPIRFPRYYAPLTGRGRLALKLNLHHGMKGVLPEFALNLVRAARSRLYNTGTGVLNERLPSSELRSVEKG